MLRAIVERLADVYFQYREVSAEAGAVDALWISWTNHAK